MTMHRPFALAGLLLAGGSALAAGPLPKMPANGFDVYSVDGKGGGWVLHRLPGRGDTVWGCADVANVQTCKQVMFNEWRPAATFKFLHINKTTQDAWLKLSAPGLGDHLYACGAPEGEPTCTRVDFDLRMKPMPTLDRVWPPYGCAMGCGDQPVGEDDPRHVIEDAANGTIWVELGLKVPGPSNLYACRGLGKSPECKLAVPNWLVLDRQDVGIDKLEDIVVENPDGTKTYGPGVKVGKMDEASTAFAAGVREGMIITKVGPFTVDDNTHARAMLAQYPAERPIVLTLSDGKTIEVVPKRKPAGGK
jgi:hypothetical protein